MIPPIEITRDDLYQEVWAVPMRTLAAKYGLSDVGLAKVCRRMAVPVPGRGYWARKAAGGPARRLPLRPLRDDAPHHERIATFDHRRIERHQALSEGELALFARFEADAANRVVVPDSLRGLHPVVRATMEALRAAKPGAALVPSPRHGTVKVTVSPTCLRRAIRVANAIAKALEQRGWKVVASTTDGGYAAAMVLGEAVPFSIHERQRKAAPKPAKTIRLGPGEYYTPRAEVTYELTGQLVLCIDNSWGDGLRRTWGDGRRQTIEEMLNDFLLHLVLAAHERRQWRQRLERQEREWEQARLARLEEDRRRAVEASRVKALRTHAEDWAVSEQLTGFLAAVRRRLDDHPDGGTPDAARDDWLAWAAAYADQINPLERPLQALWTVPS